MEAEATRGATGKGCCGPHVTNRGRRTRMLAGRVPHTRRLSSLGCSARLTASPPSLSLPRIHLSPRPAGAGGGTSRVDGLRWLWAGSSPGSPLLCLTPPPLPQPTTPALGTLDLGLLANWGMSYEVGEKSAQQPIPTFQQGGLRKGLGREKCHGSPRSGPASLLAPGTQPTCLFPPSFRI